MKLYMSILLTSWCSRYSFFMIDIFTCQICHTSQAAVFHISRICQWRCHESILVQMPLLYSIFYHSYQAFLHSKEALKMEFTNLPFFSFPPSHLLTSPKRSRSAWASQVHHLHDIRLGKDLLYSRTAHSSSASLLSPTKPKVSYVNTPPWQYSHISYKSGESQSI